MMARRVTKWGADCDRRLDRIMCYINCTKDLVQKSYCGDKMDDLKLALFCDADFAGDKSDSKSTTGVVVCIAGPTTFFPVVTLSKKQGCVSTSTCESEIVAMSVGLREALNVMDVWEVVFNKFSGKIPAPKKGPQSGGIGAQAPTLEIEREVPLLVLRR